jgi:hypothetical protein
MNLYEEGVVWTLEIPIQVELDEESLREFPANPEHFTDMLQEQFAEMTRMIVTALEEAAVHVDDDFSSDHKEIGPEPIDKDLN